MQNTDSYKAATEKTPLLITAPSAESINNPLQEKIKIKRQKVVYSSITLADIFQKVCLLYTSPSPRDKRQSRMPSSA